MRGKASAISARIPKRLKERMQITIERFGYVNEADFLREAIRTHIYALERNAKEEVVKVEPSKC